MEIKLNKELQKKLNVFLETKDEKMLEFLKILELDKFSFTKNEINNIEDLYKKNNALREYIYTYMGEAVIQVAGGFWTICNLKKDTAYGLPIILGWGGDINKPRISPNAWLYYIDKNDLRKPLGDMIYSL